MPGQGRAGSGDRPPEDLSLPPLGAEERRTLGYASAIGSEFGFGLLVAAMAVDEETLAERLEGLVRRGILLERAGGGQFAFTEERVRADIYRSLTESHRRVLHRKIAEVMERLRPDPSPEVLSELGRHYFLGKVHPKSYDLNRRAAEIARAAGEPDVAIHNLERAAVELEALPGDRRAERAEVAEALGDLYYSKSNFRAAGRHYNEALERVDREQPRVRARLLLARAEIARESLDLEAAIEGASQALHLFEGVEDWIGVAQAHRVLGRVAFLQGRYRDALDQNMQALGGLPASAGPDVKGRLSLDIGNAFSMLGGDVATEAREWLERAVEQLRRGHDTVELSRALHNLGVTAGETHPQEGLEYLQQAREIADRTHDTRRLGRVLLSGIEMRLALGQVQEARRDNEQAAKIVEGLADGFWMEQAVLNRGMIAEKTGQWDDAGTAYERAVEMSRAAHLAVEESEAQFFLARLRFKTRDFVRAREALRRATDLRVAELVPRLAPLYEQLRRNLEDQAPDAGPPPTSDPSPPAPERGGSA